MVGLYDSCDERDDPVYAEGERRISERWGFSLSAVPERRILERSLAEAVQRARHSITEIESLTYRLRQVRESFQIDRDEIGACLSLCSDLMTEEISVDMGGVSITIGPGEGQVNNGLPDVDPIEGAGC